MKISEEEAIHIRNSIMRTRILDLLERLLLQLHQENAHAPMPTEETKESQLVEKEEAGGIN